MQTIVPFRWINYLQNIHVFISFIVNKVQATDSSVSPGFINSADNTCMYISVPWFRFTLTYGSCPQSTLPPIQTVFDQDKTDLLCCDWN